MRWRRRGKRINGLENCIKIWPNNCPHRLSHSRNGTASSSSQYPLYHQQQQQYYHQQISKSKRSKSMDDFGTQMVFEQQQQQSNRVHRSNVRNGGRDYHQSPSTPSQMGKRSPPNNALVRASNYHPPQPQHKNQMRYSVDNLLEIDTSYYDNYQVSWARWLIRSR